MNESRQPQEGEAPTWVGEYTLQIERQRLKCSGHRTREKIFSDGDFNAVYSASTGSINIVSNGSSPSKLSPPKSVPLKQAENPKLPNIVNALARTYWPMFVLGASMKFIYDVLQFVQPKLLELMIDFIKDPNQELWKGLLYAALMFVGASIQSIILSVYFHRMYIVGMRMRTALISAVYRYSSNRFRWTTEISISHLSPSRFISRLSLDHMVLFSVIYGSFRKSLVLSNSAKKTTTTGEIVNLMSNDAQKFLELMTFVNMIWSAPLQIILSIYFLWEILGVAVLSGLAVMILMIPLNAVLANLQKKLQVKRTRSLFSLFVLQFPILLLASDLHSKRVATKFRPGFSDRPDEI